MLGANLDFFGANRVFARRIVPGLPGGFIYSGGGVRGEILTFKP